MREAVSLAESSNALTRMIPISTVIMTNTPTQKSMNLGTQNIL